LSEDQAERVDRESEKVDVKVKEAVNLPLGQIDVWEKNPNVMGPQAFQDLTDDIIQSGFDEPIGVFPSDKALYEEKGHDAYIEGGGRFQCWNGNHRLTVMKDLEATEIPGYVSPDLDGADVAIQVVRRNLVRGDLDPVKFTEMVNEDLFGIDPEVLARQMGFDEAREFADLIDAAGLMNEEPSKEGDKEPGESSSSSSRGGDVIDGLASMISQIMSRYGETAAQSYLCFVWKDKVHFLGAMDDKTKRQLDKLHEVMDETGENLNDVLTQMIEERLGGED